MQTKLTRSPDTAAEYIKRGGVCAFPTETVYGLGADVFDEAAIARIFEAKRRPANNPLIAHVSSVDQVGGLARTVTVAAHQLIERFFPGPLSIVLKKRERVPPMASAGLDTIGIRMPAASLASELIRACRTPLVAPSANLSGRPSPTTWEAVLEDMGGRIECILQGGQTEIGLESTVIDCSGDVPILLRRGSVSIEELQSVVGEVRIPEHNESEPVRSPGLLHRHYSPAARVEVWTGNPVSGDASAFIGLSRPDATFDLERICRDADEYARSLFEFFRECDRAGISVIYCEEVEEAGIGAALMDRIKRASE